MLGAQWSSISYFLGPFFKFFYSSDTDESYFRKPAFGVIKLNPGIYDALFFTTTSSVELLV